MAQSLLTQKGNVRNKPKGKIGKTPISDWDSSLHSIWLEKMILNPIFDDARISHISGLCKCGCTRAFVLEVRKKKK
jgi:hypothetical protein